MSTVRVGRPRSHREGISLNIFRNIGGTSVDSESVLLATAYGADEREARMRANVIAHALGEHYGSKVRT